jgi:hypothetical protein
LKFDAKKLARIGWAYNIESHIQTRLLEPDSPDSTDGSIEAQGHQKQYDDVKNADNHQDNHKKLSDMVLNRAYSSTQTDIRQPIASQEPSEPSEPSADDTIEQQQILNSIYRLGHSDLFACKNCKINGDIQAILITSTYLGHIHIIIMITIQ